MIKNNMRRKQEESFCSLLFSFITMVLVSKWVGNICRTIYCGCQVLGIYKYGGFIIAQITKRNYQPIS